MCIRDRYRDGVAVGAVIAGKTRYLVELDAEAREAVRSGLVRRTARSLGSHADGRRVAASIG